MLFKNFYHNMEKKIGYLFNMQNNFRCYIFFYCLPVFIFCIVNAIYPIGDTFFIYLFGMYYKFCILYLNSIIRLFSCSVLCLFVCPFWLDICLSRNDQLQMFYWYSTIEFHVSVNKYNFGWMIITSSLICIRWYKI